MPTAAAKQKDRFLQLHTPLESDVLLINGFTGQQEISTPFRYKLEMLAEVGQNISFKKLIGHVVTVKMADGGEISGLVARISGGQRQGKFQLFEADIVPWTHLFTLRANCRVFQ